LLEGSALPIIAPMSASAHFVAKRFLHTSVFPSGRRSEIEHLNTAFFWFVPVALIAKAARVSKSGSDNLLLFSSAFDNAQVLDGADSTAPRRFAGDDDVGMSRHVSGLSFFAPLAVLSALHNRLGDPHDHSEDESEKREAELIDDKGNRTSTSRVRP